MTRSIWLHTSFSGAAYSGRTGDKTNLGCNMNDNNFNCVATSDTDTKNENCGCLDAIEGEANF
eukprot:scaffold4693_cov149-Skeletonema_menzelii.AAC.3